MEHKTSRTQIVGTIGPASSDPSVLQEMIRHQLDVARLNFSWGTLDEHARYIADIRAAAKEVGRRIPIIQDIPGPRIQSGDVHAFDATSSVITDEDREFIAFGREQKVDYIAVSFVRTADDMEEARSLAHGIPLIAKIERAEAVDNIDSIADAADAVMIARGDLGDNVPLEQLPFLQVEITEKVHAQEKPVITATEMLLSMVERERPTRAEVTDVAYAIMNHSDAVMLSEETAAGTRPIDVIKMMERIVCEAEHVGERLHAFYHL